MKKYFLHNGKEQHGPYSLDELQQKGLTAKTMVWFDGISNWTEAQFIPELKDFVVSTPPPFEKANPINQTFDKAKKVLDKDYVNKIEEKIPNNTGKKVFKYSLIILALVGLVFIITKLMPTKEGKEKSDATEFLSLQGAELQHMFPPYYSDRKPYWQVSGKITNNATTTAYKDVKLEIEFFTSTNTSLGKTTVIIYKKFAPNNQEDKYDKYSYFDVKLDGEPPKDISDEKTKFKILDAAVYESEKASQ
ncbi:MAG: DUF4339 domain-containing protein [Bacteroidota bacterium]|jgi:transposase